MAGASKEVKLSLKIMIDMKAKKVVFTEANYEFVDFLFNLMSLPLSVVTKALLPSEKGMAGSLGSLYNSIDSLDIHCFESNTNKETVLRPSASVVLPLLSLREWPESTHTVFACEECRFVSNVPGTWCSCLRFVMNDLRFNYAEPSKNASSPRYVRGGVVYMVTDNLEVKPLSVSLIKSHVRDFNKLEEKHVQVGLQEGLAILKASLETKNVLTIVFLKKI